MKNINNLFLRGSEWIKCDLQIHSPASYDYKNKSATSEQIVKAIGDKGFKLIAITDHWSVDSIDDIRKLALGEGHNSSSRIRV